MTFGRQWMVAVLFLVCALGVPRESFAILGWIEQMSGPGPFKPAVQLSLDRLLCFMKDGNVVNRFAKSLPAASVNNEPQTQDVGVTASESADVRAAAEAERIASLFCHEDDPTQIRGFLSFEYATGTSVKNVLFPDDPDAKQHEVDLRSPKLMMYYRVHSTLDIGGGLALNFFAGDFPLFYRISIPVRARIVPAPWLRKAGRWRAFYLGLQGDWYPETFRGEDFGAPPGWTAENEFQTSVFGGIDFLLLLGPSQKE
jgi:hypothetical protein